nr:hypothetical protein MarFTME_339 [Marseillevirus futianmevirus]
MLGGICFVNKKFLNRKTLSKERKNKRTFFSQ